MTNQRKILVCGLLAFVLCALFPPWLYTYYQTGTSDSSGWRSEKDAGYHSIFTPPPPQVPFHLAGVRLDAERLLIEWLCVGAIAGIAWLMATVRGSYPDGASLDGADRQPAKSVSNAEHPGIPHSLEPLTKGVPVKRTPFFVATCGGPLTAQALQALICSPLQRILGKRFSVETRAFEFTEGLLEVGNASDVRPFDLVFILRWPYSPLIARGKGRPEPQRLVAELKARFGKPVIVIGLTSWCHQIGDADPGWEQSGADVYLEVDFSTEGFVAPDSLNRALETCVAKSQTIGQSAEMRDNSTPQKHETQPPRIVVVDDEEFCLDLFTFLIRYWFKDPKLLLFSTSGAAWQELSQTDPDLLILDMPLSGMDLLPALSERKVNYPILATSSFWAEMDVRERAGPDLKVTMLDKPFSVEQFHHCLLTLIGPSDNPARLIPKQPA